MTDRQMVGKICWMLLLGNGLLSMATAHVCDNKPFGFYECDPASSGTRFFVCMAGHGSHKLMACPGSLVFDVATRACNWPQSADTCDRAEASPTPTPTPATATATTGGLTATATTGGLTATATTGGLTATATATTAPTEDAPLPHPTSSTPGPTGRVARPCLGRADNTRLCDPRTNGSTFLVCVRGRAVPQTCVAGTFFQQRTGVCDWRRNIAVMCQTGPAPAASPTPPAGPAPTATQAPLPTGDCDASTCRLPDCRCAGPDIPGQVPVEEVPQMVLVTFDDRIGRDNFHYYPRLFWDRPGGVLTNPNGCPTAATFFVSNDGNSMPNVRKVWRQGHELASHSLTHSQPSAWSLTPGRWTQEMQGMRELMAQFVNTSVSEIGGMRMPFLALGGEDQFSMMRHNGFQYDSSFIAGSLDSASPALPLWPFTLDFPPVNAWPRHVQCAQAGCPTRSYPGLWEVPLVWQYGLDDRPCSMTDGCAFPADATAADVTSFLRQNFRRHYRGNRAPFMISLHTTWFGNVAASFQGLHDFLAEVQADPQVWQVTVSQMLDWVRHPVPMHRLGQLASWRPCP